MNEETEAWRTYKEHRQEKRRSNLQNSTELLEQNNISFESKNNGVHLIITTNAEVIDFWPSTGKFTPRGGKPSRGVKQLIKRVKK